ncbi:UNVERIFIED_CONTAM: hypothetical protein FKN15_007852 [Acipenser sinensis]
MPAADGDSAGEEEDGSAGSDEDGWEEGLSDTSQLSDITASQRGKLYSLTEISDFLEKTKGNSGKRSLKHASSETYSCQSIIFCTMNPQRSHQTYSAGGQHRSEWLHCRTTGALSATGVASAR